MAQLTNTMAPTDIGNARLRLQAALGIAFTAVERDKANDSIRALKSYEESVALLNDIILEMSLEQEERKQTERKKLETICQTYRNRIVMLRKVIAAVVPSPEEVRSRL
ncbi:hypothetical protein B0H34DRAFT_387337 [Crassisporium funariophilum]|nr:hypothetical protein B0H34DRAFT_387337 [Crassisporium funariophilum]